jgi:cobalt/nickel transport system permease protein
MHIIDQYAYNNRIHQVDPAYKVGLALIVVMLCLILNKPLVGLAAVGWMYGITVYVTGIPGRTFVKLIGAEGAFLMLTVVGVVVNFSLADPGPISTWAWSVGSIWISSSPASLYRGLTLVTRALGAAAAMNFLALTTPLVDMIELFRRWRIPGELIDIMTIVYRSIFVLLESLDTMYQAQESRLGYNTSYWRAMNSAALLGSRLFVEAFQRSRRMQIALESRGYEDGNLQVLPSSYQSGRMIAWLGLTAVTSLVLIWIIG